MIERMTSLSFLFKPAARYPADPRAVFILALSVFTGVTTLALNAGPDSLEALLPTWVVIVWGALLTLGSATTLVGMFLQSVNGIIIEQVGSVMVAATTLFYSLIAFATIGIDALSVVGIIFAWGLSCGLRWFQLQSLINNEIGRQRKRARLDALEEEIRARVAEEVRKPRMKATKGEDLGRWGTQ